tara:strand:- start:820 stop:1677 length:858 start_codon:yes stop_codon:yes gene_type:complete
MAVEAGVNFQTAGSIVKLLLISAALATLVGCNTSIPVQPKKVVVVPLSTLENTDVMTVENAGRIMYEKDIRAASATDLLLEKIDPTDYPGFVGWVTYPNDSDYTVTFYERESGSYSLIADVVFDGAANPQIIISPERSISKTETSMISARITAMQNGQNACAEKFNSVVLEGSTPAEWDVYVLAATTDPAAVTVGGNTKVSISKDTGEIIAITPLSNTCLTLNTQPDDMPEGASLAMLTMTHIVSDYPVAIHPYLNLMHQIPFAVFTKRGMWIIEEGKISLESGS